MELLTVLLRDHSMYRLFVSQYKNDGRNYNILVKSFEEFLYFKQFIKNPCHFELYPYEVYQLRTGKFSTYGIPAS